MYRPFCKKHLHYQAEVIESPSKFDHIFPDNKSNNLVINLSTELRQNSDIGVLISNVHTDLHLLGDTKCIPRHYCQGADNSLLGNDITSSVGRYVLEAAQSRYRIKINEDDHFLLCLRFTT